MATQRAQPRHRSAKSGGDVMVPSGMVMDPTGQTSVQGLQGICSTHRMSGYTGRSRARGSKTPWAPGLDRSTAAVEAQAGGTVPPRPR